MEDLEEPTFSLVGLAVIKECNCYNGYYLLSDSCGVAGIILVGLYLSTLILIVTLQGRYLASFYW